MGRTLRWEVGGANIVFQYILVHQYEPMIMEKTLWRRHVGHLRDTLHNSLVLYGVFVLNLICVLPSHRSAV